MMVPKQSSLPDVGESYCPFEFKIASVYLNLTRNSHFTRTPKLFQFGYCAMLQEMQCRQPGVVRNFIRIKMSYSASRLVYIWVQSQGGGSVDMYKSQRHTRLGAGRGERQANEAAFNPKLTGLCQHEIVSGILKKWTQCGTVQASYGCLVTCAWASVSQFFPTTLQHFSLRS
jgi:hypothetical protein